MKVRLVCRDGRKGKQPAFVIAVENGEARIVREGAPLIESDSSAEHSVESADDVIAMRLCVEAVP